MTTPLYQTELLQFAVRVLGFLSSTESDGKMGALIGNSFLGCFPCQSLQILESTLDGWKARATAGILPQVPEKLAAQTADSQCFASDERWSIWPLRSLESTGSQRLLAIYWRTVPSEELLLAATQAVEVCHLAFSVSGQRKSVAERLSRMQSVLSIVTAWHQHRDIDQLLEQLAIAAAKILNADRSSIFLWDRNARQLIGHPALGFEKKPLRIPDDMGIVGAVLSALEPKRWDRSDDPSEVNRKVDQETGYTTHSLLAVPLIDSRNKPLGVFELINHRDGKFSPEDEAALLELAKPVAAAVEGAQVLQEVSQSRDRLIKAATDRVQIIGNCSAIDSLRNMLARVANTDLAVMLLGENGTGKEVVARTIHLQSRRRTESFIAVNCAAIAETLLESELFGHEKGAFTDAVAARPGKFELASGGTLFLDEIGDMSLAGQSKLLRVLEDKIVVRVGGSTPIHTDVRVVAATNQNLAELVRAKRFREDLFFRLNVVTLHLPPLRERGGDILELADFFLDHFCHKIGRKPLQLSPRSKERLLAHSWPGNVRELRNLMERIAYLSVGEEIDESELAYALTPSSLVVGGRIGADSKSRTDRTETLVDATHNFQIEHIQAHIDAAKQNMSKAAETLGLHRSNLYRKMKQLGMSLPDEL